MIVKHIKVKSALSRSGLKELDYSLNPYYGCVYSCTYCYARFFTPQRDASENWGEIVYVKDNLLDVLSKEVHSVRKGIVGISTITDPYQPVESIYKLTRASIELLLKKGFRISIQTKSPLILRDLDILRRYSKLVDVGFTVTTMNNYREVEPKAPPPKARLEALRKLINEGIETWLFIGPIIPGVTEDFEEIIREVSNIKARIVYDKYRQYKTLKYKSGDIKWWKGVKGKIEELCKKYSLECHEESEDWIYERRKFYKPLF